jgi:hypothetical protein
LTPVEIFRRSSIADPRSPVHRPDSARRSTEPPMHRPVSAQRSTDEIANRKITLLMTFSTVLFTVTWIPVWIALSGFVDSLTLEHFSFLNQVINPVLYSLSNKRFRTHLKTLLTFKK